MCIIFLAYNQHPEYPIIIASNRDEFHARPTNDATFWRDSPNLLAGQDMSQEGAWLGLTRSARFAALTNFRELEPTANAKTESPERLARTKSRGWLVRDFLNSNQDGRHHLEQLNQYGQQYPGFNLLFGSINPSGPELYYYSNRSTENTEQTRALTPGYYTLCNHLLDTPWPKVVTGSRIFKETIPKINEAADLLSLLQHNQQPDDKALPNTGVGIDIERLVAPIFVNSPTYGTRSSTVILVKSNGKTQYLEQQYSQQGQPSHQKEFELRL